MLNGMRALARETAIAQGWFPNSVYYDRGKTTVALVVNRSSQGDFALSAKALADNLQVITKGKLKSGFVILRDWIAQKEIAELPMQKIAKRLEKVPKQRGPRGDYWWLDEHGEPVELSEAIL